MTTNAPIIQELEKSLHNIMQLQMSVLSRSVRVEQVPVAGPRIDVTDKFADALKDGANALTKAIAALNISLNSKD
jgi:hypothetical protein